MDLPPKVLFKLGCVVLTAGAREALEASGESPWSFLTRHVAGDWGDLGEEDKSLNDLALRDHSRILSAYMTAKGEKLWVITEADRSVTTLLLPEEY